MSLYVGADYYLRKTNNIVRETVLSQFRNSSIKLCSDDLGIDPVPITSKLRPDK